MAQHDYIIDNQTSASLRADLNNALAAIVSQNSGTTAPSTTYPNQFWYDTTNDQLKQRNESNTVWVTLGTVDQTNNKFEPNQTFSTQAQAEAGSENTKAMTALRTAQAIAVLAVPTAAQVLNATAAASVGAVGTYAWLLQPNYSSTGLVEGGTYAGSSLVYFAMMSGSNGGVYIGFTGSSPAGTWRSMGFNNDPNGGIRRGAVFLRIS
jgi:hypothetical protein